MTTDTTITPGSMGGIGMIPSPVPRPVELDYASVARRMGIPVAMPALHSVPDHVDAIVDDTRPGVMRPDAVEDMIGQERVRAQIRVMVRAAIARGEQPGHILLSGPAGLGKTTLGLLVAKETHGVMVQTAGISVRNPHTLAKTLAALRHGDVLFIDEIHMLGNPSMTMLLTAMEDLHLDVPAREGTSKAVSIDLEPFTLVGATTDAGKLSAPLRARFALIADMSFYSHDELARIVLRQADRDHATLTDDAALAIAARGRDTPRDTLALWEKVFDFTVANFGMEETPPVDVTIAHAAFAMFDVDSAGLSSIDQTILRTLCELNLNGPIGIDSLAASCGMQKDAVQSAEDYMVRAGLVRRTQRGRRATKAAYKHFGLQPPVDAEW